MTNDLRLLDGRASAYSTKNANKNFLNRWAWFFLGNDDSLEPTGISWIFGQRFLSAFYSDQKMSATSPKRYPPHNRKDASHVFPTMSSMHHAQRVKPPWPVRCPQVCFFSMFFFLMGCFIKFQRVDVTLAKTALTWLRPRDVTKDCQNRENWEKPPQHLTTGCSDAFEENWGKLFSGASFFQFHWKSKTFLLRKYLDPKAYDPFVSPYKSSKI